MSNERSETDEEEQAEMLIRAMTEKNVTKIEHALAKTKKHGKGFVLSSHFYKPKPRSTSPKERRRSSTPQTTLPIVIGSPIGSPAPSRKPSLTQRSSPPPRTKSAFSRRRKTEVIEESPRPQSAAYLTEYIPPPIKVDMAIQSDGPEQTPTEPQPESPVPPPGTPDISQEVIVPEPEQPPVEEPVPVPEPMEEEKENIVPPKTDAPLPLREEPLGNEAKTNEERRISYPQFRLLGLPKRPKQFHYGVEMPPTHQEIDPQNPAPEHPNIWITRVPKQGGEVNTPFYMQIHMPNGALRGDVIMKFETQSYSNSKLELNETDKLCSDIIDINMKPLAYCLHQKATVRVRILEDCINKFDDVTFISARNFKWSKHPTEVEAVEVNGNTHYYAVTKTQQLGKFAVVTSRKVDRFVMTSAGGLFTSTVLPDVTIQLNEGVLKDLAHFVEVSIQDTRKEVVVEKRKVIFKRGADHELVATSPIVDISKEIMGKTGTLEDGVSFPENVRFTVPVTTFVNDDKMKVWKKPTLKVMQKYCHEKLGETDDEELEIWNDISDENTLFDALGAQSGGKIPINASLPCQLLVLIFDESDEPPKLVKDRLEDICEGIQQRNLIYNVAIMVHQKVGRPQIINIHVIPAKAKDMVAGAMEVSDEWKLVGKISTDVRVKERENLEIQFKGDVKLTINQMEPQITFHSRRWQGHQYQIEATDEGYANSNGGSVSGAIKLVKRKGDADYVVHSSTVTIPHRQAKPYRPTVIVRPLPKVAVFREYKLKWLKNLSEGEKLKYQSINTP